MVELAGVEPISKLCKTMTYNKINHIVMRVSAHKCVKVFESGHFVDISVIELTDLPLIVVNTLK